MPYLKINSNVLASTPKELVLHVSAAISKALGKPESYVMVVYEHNTHMVFAGNDAPLAYLELKSIGLPEAQTKTLSDTLCTLINETLSVPTERIYIEFANAQRHLWGWNKQTF